MNTLEKQILIKVAEGRLPQAQKYLRAFLNSDKRKADAQFVADLSDRLDKTSNSFVENLPFNLKNILKVDSLNASLISRRYVSCEEDDSVVSKLEKAFRVRERLDELSIQYFNAAIFYGVSGCGKTMLGKYIAARLNLPFVYLNVAGVVNSYMGKTSLNLSSAFEFVNKHSCVFMLDEIDALARTRTVGVESGSCSSEENRITISIMQLLDSFLNNSILLMATNRLDIIDKAILRRIPLRYEMKPMSKERKIKMIAAYLDTIPSARYSAEGIERWLNPLKEETNNSYIITALVQWLVDRIADGEDINMA